MALRRDFWFHPANEFAPGFCMIRFIAAVFAAVLAVTAQAAEGDFGRLSDAAAAGSAADQLQLATLLDAGIGLPRDRAEAFLWYSRAALAGEPRAQHRLGQIFETGEGVPRNVVLARAWYRAAAEKLPAAAERLQTLIPIPAASLGVPEIRLANRLPGGGVEIVWVAPEQPSGTSILVEGRGSQGSLFVQEADRTVLRLQPAKGDQISSVRVVVLDAARARYSASGWLPLGRTADPEPVSNLDVSLLFATEPAARLAEDLKRDLDVSGVPAKAQRVDSAAGPEPAVVYFYETDRAAAEAVAALLPAGLGAPRRQASDAEGTPLPGRIEIHLNGSGEND